MVQLLTPSASSFRARSLLEQTGRPEVCPGERPAHHGPGAAQPFPQRGIGVI